MVDMSPEAVSARLRLALEGIRNPVLGPDPEHPTPEQVGARLREACGLWAACVRLEAAVAAPSAPAAPPPDLAILAVDGRSTTDADRPARRGSTTTP